MENSLKAVHAWQHASGNVAKGYDAKREAAFQIEEALEELDSTDVLVKILTDAGVNVVDNSPKEISRAIVSIAHSGREIKKVKALDKHIDSIIFDIGSIAKLGLSPQELNKAILIVNRANQQKLVNASFDSENKLNKPDNFVCPEMELQKLLDSLGK